MATDYEDMVRSLVPAKVLAIAAYGESVAAYRYRTLSQKTTSQILRDAFVEMASEEQGHHGEIQQLIAKHFPGSDFVLTPQDKELVIAGPRLLDPQDAASLEEAMGMIHDSEQLTGRFYRMLEQTTPLTELKPTFKSMADECFEHAKKLKALAEAARDE